MEVDLHENHRTNIVIPLNGDLINMHLMQKFQFSEPSDPMAIENLLTIILQFLL